MENKFVREISQDALVTEKTDIFLNGLLGVYNNNGEYFISPKITEELVKIEKAKKYAFDNSIYCESNLPGIGEIMFQIEYSMLPNGDSSAKLYILENVYKINGYLQNTIKTFLTEYIDTFDNFIEKTYNAFNVVVDYDENGRNKKITLDTYMDYYLMSKKQYLVAVQTEVESKIDDLYKRYFSKRVKILNSSNNPFAKAVLKDFNDEYDKIESKFLQTSDYKTINELLDKCVEDISGTKEEYLKYEAEFTQKTTPALKDFYNVSNELFENAQHSAVNNLYKKDKQRINEVIETEKDFLNKAVKQNKLSNVIDALSVDEYVGSEKDYEENKSETLQDIIAQIKEKQKDKEETSQEETKQTISKPIIKPKHIKETNDKIISNDQVRTANKEPVNVEDYAQDSTEQDNEQDGDVKEHPQQGNDEKNESKPVAEQKLAKKSIKNIERIIEGFNTEKVQNKKEIEQEPEILTDDNQTSVETESDLSGTEQILAESKQTSKILQTPFNDKKPVPMIKKKFDMELNLKDVGEETSNKDIDVSIDKPDASGIIEKRKREEISSGQIDNRRDSYFTNNGDVLDVVNKESHSVDTQLDYGRNVLREELDKRSVEVEHLSPQVKDSSSILEVKDSRIFEEKAPTIVNSPQTYLHESEEYQPTTFSLNEKESQQTDYSHQYEPFQTVSGNNQYEVEFNSVKNSSSQEETLSQVEIPEIQEVIIPQNEKQEIDMSQNFQKIIDKTQEVNIEQNINDGLSFNEAGGSFGFGENEANNSDENIIEQASPDLLSVDENAMTQFWVDSKASEMLTNEELVDITTSEMGV